LGKQTAFPRGGGRRVLVKEVPSTERVRKRLGRGKRRPLRLPFTGRGKTSTIISGKEGEKGNRRPIGGQRRLLRGKKLLLCASRKKPRVITKIERKRKKGAYPVENREGGPDLERKGGRGKFPITERSVPPLEWERKTRASTLSSLPIGGTHSHEPAEGKKKKATALAAWATKSPRPRSDDRGKGGRSRQGDAAIV